MAVADDIRDKIEKILSGDLEERRGAVEALSEMGTDAVDPLIELMSAETDNDVKWYASNALAKIGEPAVEQLLFTLKHYPDDNVRRYAAAALASVGEPAISGLIEIFEGDDSVTRGFASKALIRIGDPAAEPLRKYIQESDPESMPHRCAVITLNNLSPESR
ncbi:HEAT repeat protein [Methanomicrobium sp. W14]|uniref:HEAT repeat domain-containing protein n=1 Tax=Methanomicrobium sp. W14 TaxID=2817839 RepID=UPI001AE97D01|nr:HEAT repeat domain-containing protein [Methanomicrobium sp. W14]MBP2133688.1 HEAT repeat protein [Methanomicrobium sp. W14]